MSVYNGKKFPEFVFKDKTLNILFFEFNVCFSIEFVEAFTKFLLEMQVVNVTINNIEPAAITFNRTIAIENMPDEFIDVVKTTLTQDYIDAPVNFYMITELAEIYTPENKNLFC